MAKGGNRDELIRATQTLTTAIATYKQAAKTVKGLLPKKAKAKCAPKAE